METRLDTSLQGYLLVNRMYYDLPVCIYFVVINIANIIFVRLFTVRVMCV